MKVLFLIEGSKKTGPNVWAQTLKSNSKNTFVFKETFRTYTFLKTLITVFKYDFIHFYSQTPQALLIGTIGFILRKKVIFTIHGDLKTELTSKKGIKKRMWMPIHKYIFLISSGFTFPSSFNYSINKDLIPASKAIKIIPNGYDFNPEKKVININNKSKHNLFLVTSFTHSKKQQGVDYIAEVLKDLNKQDKEFILFVAGGGINLEQYKQTYIDRKDIKFLGYREDIESLFSQMGVFFYISFQDNMPVSILEAIAHGLPVVTCTTGAIPEMIPEKELVINFDKNQYIEVLNKLVKDSEYFNSVRNDQYEYAREKFDIQKVLSSFIDLYSSLSLNK